MKFIKLKSSMFNLEMLESVKFFSDGSICIKFKDGYEFKVEHNLEQLINREFKEDKNNLKYKSHFTSTFFNFLEDSINKTTDYNPFLEGNIIDIPYLIETVTYLTIEHCFMFYEKEADEMLNNKIIDSSQHQVLREEISKKVEDLKSEVRFNSVSIFPIKNKKNRR